MASVQTPSSSSSLLEGVRRCEPEAWNRLTTIYGPSVYHWCRRAGLQAADSADVTQTVFASVAVNIGQFKMDRPSTTFQGWLWVIFHSRLMDFFRDHRRDPLLVGDSEVKRLKEAELSMSATTTWRPDANETLGLVHRALKAIRADFGPSTWEAFWRTTVDGEPTSDVARELGLTPAAVCMSRSRVLRRLRETLDSFGLLSEE